MKKGFTLAEVLITLGIIGVVAAITMPALVNKSRNKEFQTALKVAYSTIQQGLDRMSADRGNKVVPDEFIHSSTAGRFYEEYKNYFNKIYDCGILSPDPKICFSRASNVTDETKFNNDLTYKTYNGNTVLSNLFDDGQFVLPNGMLIMIENPEAKNGVPRNIFISVDINGKKKKPNRLGQDVFTFQFMDNGKLIPMGADGTRYPEDEYCTNTSTSNVNGIGCANRALSENDFFENLPR